MLQTGICTQGLLGRGLLLVVVSLISVQLLVNMVIYERTNTAVYSLVFSYVHTQNNSTVLMRNTTLESLTSVLPMCPLIPPTLRGLYEIDMHIPSWSEIEANNSALHPGGKYRPQSCTARNRVAIIVPYRDREMHMKLFLQNIHPFLQRQQLDYAIFLVELAADKKFNRAMLMNIGFVEANNLYDFQCFIFHDVDLLPEDDRNLYTCPPMPRHMSAAIDKHKYRLLYTQIFGGVTAMTKEQFLKTNGYSNHYFGWGGEDDDMFRRILYSKMTVTRYPMTIARYKMLDHVKDKENPKRFRLLQESKQRWQHDGLNSLKYQRLKLEFRKLYTWIFVDFSEKDVLIPENVTTPAQFVLNSDSNLISDDQAVMKEAIYVSSNIKNADVTPVWTKQPYALSNIKMADVTPVWTRQPYASSNIKNADVTPVWTKQPYSSSNIKNAHVIPVSTKQPYALSNIKNAHVPPVWTRRSYRENSANSYGILSTSITKSQNEVATVSNKLPVQTSYIHLR